MPRTATRALSQDGAKLGMSVHDTDQSEKNRSEVERLTDLYDALRLVNHAIVHSRTREELFQEICRIAVERGGFLLAWVSWHDPVSQRFVPVAQWGDNTGFLQQAPMFADERPEGLGPTGTAFRSGKPYICNDYFKDPSTALWRVQAAKRGIRASGAFPIRLNQAVVGLLGVYASEPEYFQSRSIELLGEAASDMSYALDNFAREDERCRAEEVVKRFAAIIESTNDAIISKSLDGEITSWNPAAERLFGYTAREACGQNMSILIPSDRSVEEPQILSRIVAGEQIVDYETVRIRKDGHHFPVSVTISPIKSATGAVIGASKIVRDITERKQAADALYASEARLRNAQRIANLGNWEFDILNDRLSWSDDVLRIFGIAKSDFRGNYQAFFECVHPEDRERVTASTDAAIAGLAPFDIEHRVVWPDGSIKFVHDLGDVVRDKHGNPEFVRGSVLDITNRKRAEDEIRHLATFPELTPAIILEINRQNEIRYLNPALQTIMNRLDNQDPRQLVPGRWERRLVEPGVIEEESDVSEVELGDQVFRLLIRFMPQFDSLRIYGLEITERKRAENTLRETMNNLELMVAERTTELKVALEHAESADRLKSAFLATMSHELRTPLNSIIGFTGILIQELAGPLNLEQTKQLRMVQTSSRHLLALINDVLDISKIEAGQLDVHSRAFDLISSIERVTASVKPMAEKKGLAIHLEGHPVIGQILSDQRRVEQILMNLLSNAIKFTIQGEVTISVEITTDGISDRSPISRRRVRIRVTDTGIGIKSEDLQSLFLPFRQIDTGLTRQHEGTGLGLAICRRLAELLDGEIQVESEHGKGSTFTLSLPLEPRN